MAKSLKRRIARLEKIISDFFIGEENKPARKVRRSARQRPPASRKTKKTPKRAKRATSRKVSQA